MQSPRRAAEIEEAVPGPEPTIKSTLPTWSKGLGSKTKFPQSWPIGRTQSEDLSSEVYAMLLEAVEKHGPEDVQEKMSIPHYTDHLPQAPARVLQNIRFTCTAPPVSAN